MKKKTKKVTKRKVIKKIKPIKSPLKSFHEVVIKVENALAAKEELMAATFTQPIMENNHFTITKSWVSEKQVLRMLQRTPKEHVFTRAAKGGGTWEYVTGTYMEKVLNFVFGWNWDFQILSHGREGDQVWVHGKLTVKDDHGHSISKEQFGRADIKFKSGTKTMMDFGNDLKAAATDALKKCASQFGIASDIYGKTEFKDVKPPVEALVTAPTGSIPCVGAIKAGCPTGGMLTPEEAKFSMNIFKKHLCQNCRDRKSVV